MTTATDIQVKPLNEAAVLATLNISQWRAQRNDQRAADEVAEKHGSAKELGQFKKWLIRPEHLTVGQKIANAARAEHNRLTLPWQDGAGRILSNAGFDKHHEVMQKYMSEFWAWYNETFKPQYPTLAEEGLRLLNGLGDPTQYPGLSWTSTRIARMSNEQALDRKFGFNIGYSPVADDFRVKGLNATALREARASYENQMRQGTQRVVQDVYTRLEDGISHLVERLQEFGTPLNPNNPEGKKSFFRDSLMGNIVDLVDILPILNVTGDPNIEDFGKRIKQQITVFNVEQLRSDEQARETATKRGKTILAGIRKYRVAED